MKDLKNKDSFEEDTKEVEMATKKGCKQQGKRPPKKKGGKCGSKIKKKKSSVGVMKIRFDVGKKPRKK